MDRSTAKEVNAALSEDRIPQSDSSSSFCSDAGKVLKKDLAAKR